MRNGPTVRRKLDVGDNRIGRLLASGVDDRVMLTEVYLAALCREPKAAEITEVNRFLGRAKDRRSAWEDIVWALLNTPAFQFNH